MCPLPHYPSCRSHGRTTLVSTSQAEVTNAEIQPLALPSKNGWPRQWRWHKGGDIHRRTWLGWLMPVSHMQRCVPSQAAVQASWKCPPRALATASATAGAGSRSARSVSASSPGPNVL